MADHQGHWNIYIIQQLYASNTHEYCSTEISPFILVLRKPIQSITLPEQTTPSRRQLPTEVEKVDLFIAYRTRIIRRAAQLHQQANKFLKAAQEKYNQHHYKKIHFELSYITDDYTYEDQLPLKKSAAKRLPLRIIENSRTAATPHIALSELAMIRLRYGGIVLKIEWQ